MCLYLAKFLAHPMTKQVAAQAMDLLMQFLSKHSPATQALAGAAIGSVNNTVNNLSVNTTTPAQASAAAPAPVACVTRSQPASPVSPASPSSDCNNHVASAPASPVASAPALPAAKVSAAPVAFVAASPASPLAEAKGKGKKEGGLFSMGKKKVRYGLHGVNLHGANAVR